MDREISREEYELLFGGGEEYVHPTRRGDLVRERQDAVSPDVHAARREAAQQALESFMLRRRDPYQLNLPGVNPELMALRYRGGMTPEQEAAAGVVGRGWQRGPDLSYVEQLVLDLERQGMPANNIQQIVRQVATQEMAQAEKPRGLHGTRMAMLKYGLPALGVLGGLYGVAALTQPRSEEERETSGLSRMNP